MFILFLNAVLCLFAVGSSSTTQDMVLQRLDLLEHQYTNLQKKYDLLWGENRNLEAEITFMKNKRLLLNDVQVSQHKIGFYARIRTSGILGINQTIEFDHVQENAGNGYDSRHGHFTAPVGGLYQFSTTIYSFDQKDMNCEMIKNGQNIGLLYAPVHGLASSTLNVVVTLNIGDMVWVRHLGSSPQELNAGDYSSFSGFLIAQ